MRVLVVQLERRDQSLAHVQASEQELEQSYQECLERAKVAESARLLLEREHGQVQEELAAQEHHIRELEGRVQEEGRRREEEVGGVREELERELQGREEEVAEYTQVIAELKEDLKTSVSGSYW